MELTYDIAMAAAMDAANRQMRKQGRDKWNEDDLTLASETLEKLWFTDDS